MTNAEKYKEVFGFEPDRSMCIAISCDKCPVYEQGSCVGDIDWWGEEYVGVLPEMRGKIC